MIDNNSRLASLRQKMKDRAREKSAKPGAGTGASVPPPQKAAPGRGNDVLERLQRKKEERARKKAESQAKAAEQDSAAPVDEAKDIAPPKASPLARPVLPASPVKPIGMGAQTPGKSGFSPGNLSSLISEGRDIALELEQGQAETPVARFFASIPADTRSSWPSFSLLGLSPEARVTALRWFTGAPEKLFSPPTGLLEVLFQTRGFGFRGEGESATTPADNALDLARAMKRSGGGHGHGHGNFLHLELPAPEGFLHSEIHCPGNPGVVLDRPEVLSRMVSRTELLVVAGRGEDDWSETAEEAVAEIAPSIGTVLPVVMLEGRKAAEEAGDCPWLEGLRRIPGSRMLEPVFVDSVNLLPEARDALPGDVRPELANRALERRLESGMQLVAERQEKREQEIRKRRKDGERLQRQLEQELKDTQNASRELLDELREGLADEISGIQEWTKQRNKRQFSPTGDFTRFAAEISGELSEAHLEKVESAAAKRFGLPSVVVEALEDEVVNRLRHGVHATVEEVRSRLAGFTEGVEKRLTEFHQQPVSIELPDLNEREIWNEVRQYCEIDPKIGIDLPKRDPLRIFMSGSRQFIMPISMILGGPLAKLILPLFGADRSLLNQNPIFTGTLVGLMIVGLFLFVRNARRLDREKMDSSVEKMRETVRSKVLREMERVEKEKLEWILGELGRLKDDCQANLKVWVDEAIAASQQRLARENAKVKSAGVILQKRVREVEQSGRQVESLKERLPGKGA